MLRFSDAVHGGHGQTCSTDAVRRTWCGIEIVTQAHEVLGEVHDGRFVFIPHGEVHAAAVGDRHFGGQAGLQVSHGRVLVGPKHLTGALHFGPWCWVKSTEFDEWEDRSLDANMTRHAARNLLVGKWNPNGDVGGNASKRQPGRLRHEGNRP